jgi:hypothetical protein
MADIRINALATTATSSASDDYVAIDGSANGTRKLNAYSPTFGGNVSVTGTLGIGTSTPTYKFDVVDNSTGVQGRLSSSSSSGTSFALTNTATNGRIYRIGSNFVTGNGEFAVYDDTASAVRLTVSSAGNTTLAGNLTVSGTGTSSIGGLLTLGDGLSQASGSGIQWKLYNPSLTAAISLGVGKAESSGNTVFLGWNYNSGTPYAYLDTYGGGSPLSLQSGGGNVLIGKTADSSNGKLQLATHTTSAGGIGFGTDVSLFRAGAKLLNIAAATANYLAIQPDASTYNFQISTSGSDAGLRLTRQTVADWDITAGSSFIIKKDGTTALTLDSSQNATFAGSVKVNNANGIDINSGGTTAISSQSVSSVRKNFIYFDGTNTTFGSDTGTIKLQAAGVTALTCETSGNVTIASGKALKLGNAYVAGAPTATGYVTIQDSAGNTYKVLVGT